MKRTFALATLLVISAAVALPALAAADGGALYAKKCAMCHGKDGVAKAMAKGSANLNDGEFQKAATAESIEAVVSEGKGKMPAYKEKLSAEEIKAIATHVKTMAPTE